jgi:hypothetical protein
MPDCSEILTALKSKQMKNFMAVLAQVTSLQTHVFVFMVDAV